MRVSWNDATYRAFQPTLAELPSSIVHVANDDYFSQQLGAAAAAVWQLPPAQQLAVAQQAASQTQGPPSAHAQPSSTQAQFAQTHSAPQQQLAAFAAEPEKAGAANAAAKETVTRPKIAAIYFNMTSFLKTCVQNEMFNEPSEHMRAVLP